MDQEPTTIGRLFRLSCGALLLAAAGFQATPASAVVYVMPTDESMVDRSPLIVFGEVRSAAPGPDGNAPTTDYQFAIEEVLKGLVGGSAIVVRQPGGIGADGIAMRVMGLPMFAEGDRVLLFLRPEEAGAHAIVEYALGMFWEVDVGARSLLLREPSMRAGTRTAGAPAPGAEPGGELPRDTGRFRHWIADRVAGVERSADYFETELPSGPLAVQSRYRRFRTPANCPHDLLPVRWQDFDLGRNLRLTVESGGQAGVPGGGTAELRTAMRAWNNDAGSHVSLAVAGTGTPTAENTRPGGSNPYWVLFEDPFDRIPGSYDPQTGGTLAVTITYYPCGAYVPVHHTLNDPPVQALQIGYTQLITQDGYGEHWVALNENPRQAHEEVMAHELGHVLGIEHSCSSRTYPCPDEDAVPEAIMPAHAHGDSRGARLSSEDRTALRYLYPMPSASRGDPDGVACSGATCLLQGERFRVKAWYSRDGSPGQGAEAIAAALGDSAGLFSADSGSPELLVRMVNRCSTAGYWAVHAGAASDAAFSVAVRDTRSNELRWFQVRNGQSVAETGAFACRAGDAGTATGPGVDPNSACSGVTCLLQAERFRVKSWYARGSSGQAGAIAVDLGEAAGLFTFDGGSPELLVRIANRCDVRGYWAVYAGAASDADFSVAVRDTRSNELKWFQSRDGQLVADAAAFPCSRGDASEPDRAALVAFYEATSGPNWYGNDNWLTDAPLDEWHGVETDGLGNVTQLDLSNNFLVGKLPPELGRLAHLELLNLAGQPLLEGPIPPELFDLTELRHLNFCYTGIGGPLTPSIAKLVNLVALWWCSSGLTGPIPSELGNLTKLREISLSGNYMVGPIPPELGDLSNLRWLSLGVNELAGPIPAELGRLSALQSFDLERNHLSGEIPAALGNVAGLLWLDLSENELSGSIPEALGNLTNLRRLDLGGNGLKGSIPSWSSALGELLELYLQDNALKGSIPEGVGDLRNLLELWVGNNAGLSGAVPVSLARLDKLRSFQAGGTGLCAPQDAELLTWLSRVPTHRLGRCELASAYLTQAVQSREFPVPLVAGQPALLRVFLASEKAAGRRIPDVRATFYVDHVVVHAVNIVGGAGRIPREIYEGSLATSANADVPGSVIRPGLEMVIEIDPDETLDPDLAVGRRIPVRGRIAVDVVELPDFQLTLVPFLYEADPDYSILEITAGMASAPETHPMLADTRAFLPMNGMDVQLHDAVLTSTNSGFTILQETEMIRLMEGRPGYWLSMLAPVRYGLLGVAFVPGWTSFAVPTPDTVAHEIGHNMSLYHAPCGGAGGSDPLYPHASGVIGSWGYDRDKKRLVSPYAPDLMSYCRSYWISEYHHANALRHRVASEGVGASGARSRSEGVSASDGRRRSVLVWGGRDADGDPFLEPSVIADALPSLPPPGRDYMLRGTTGDGSEAFSLRFDIAEIQDVDDGRSGFVFAIPVTWEGPLEHISLQSREGVFILDEDTDLPLTILHDPVTGQVQAILRRPVTEAIDVAGNRSFEVLFSRGVPTER